MSLDLHPSPATLDKAVRVAKEKLSRHVQYSTAVYEAAQQAGIDPSVLYREMSERSKKHRRKVAQVKRRAQTVRECLDEVGYYGCQRGAA